DRKIMRSRVGKTGIGDQGPLFVSLCLPLFECISGKGDGLAFRLPEKISATVELHFVPGAGQQFTAIPNDNVPFEHEAQVLFGSRGLQLMSFTECEDVVADDVLFAVMLMEAAGL